jgi:hypothetical protein
MNDFIMSIDPFFRVSCRTCFTAVFAIITLASCTEERIDFSTQVKPIINKRCITCHGGVKSNGGFSLLFRDDALDTIESGKLAIVPGHPEASEMIKRLTASDPEERMPYKEEPLPKDEIDILKKWIAQGAEWGDHWAYVPPKPVEVPKSKNIMASMDEVMDWPKNDIDYFILDRLAKEKLKPSKEADREMLLRRVYLDLIGIPPTPEQAQAFLMDSSENAYEKLVDQLLSYPQYGEKWTSWWLDLARYSDTKGYERDVGRTIWRYRDYVIKAFNKDMPFDQFTIEQLAGDLLPNPTDDQLIATAFHRNTMNNDEGGTEDEEFRVAATLDRVNTTYEVWQSTTMGCVQCHSHPYDPFKHQEYYQSLAFFNNSRDEDTHGEHPNLRMFTKDEDQQKLEEIKSWVMKYAGERQMREVTTFLKTFEPKYHPHDFDEFVNTELNDTKWLALRKYSAARLKSVDLTNQQFLIIDYWADNKTGTLEVRADKVDGPVIASGIKLNGRGAIRTSLTQQLDGIHDLFFVYKNPLGTPTQNSANIVWVAFQPRLPGVDQPEYVIKEKVVEDLLHAQADLTPVMIENIPQRMRPTFMFERGNWLVHGKQVDAAVPDALNNFPKDVPRNRLGFAKWLVSKENPLTARSLVNRLWEQIFGYGIIETLEDFGTQSPAPSHPELLDWLALRLMNENSWSMKKTIKDIVMSATYRQDSRVKDDVLAADPSNRLLARGPRVRLSAEQVRDQALSVAGLLSRKMFGKSVMPYQPDGIWSSVWSGEYWMMSDGEDQFRRSVYTYSKRTSPYPSMMMFDGASREVCVSRRVRTNTPLQALVTLNDSTYLVAARSFAKQMAAQAETPKEQIRSGYKSILIRDIPEKKLAVLSALYNEMVTTYAQDQKAADKLMGAEKTEPQLAAMTIVAQAMLNLDEVITKE